MFNAPDVLAFLNNVDWTLARKTSLLR
jgi:hypothetical protein